MHVRISAFTSAVVVLSLGTAGCNDRDNGAGLTARLARPSPFESQLVSIQPARLRPEFLSDRSCPGLRPFRTRFSLFVHADRGFALRGVGFEFRDRAGGRALPLPIPTTVTGPTIPNSVPVGIPSSAPIPIPGTLPFNGVTFSSGIHAIGLVLNFHCGVPAEGTLSVGVETTDGDGAHRVSHVTVPVG